MLDIFKKALVIAVISTVILLLYSIISEAIETIKIKRNVKSKQYLKDFLSKLINTVLIFFPMFLIIFCLICLAISEITQQF